MSGCICRICVSAAAEDPRLVEREIELERETTARALEEYKEIYDKLVSVGQGANLPAVQKLMFGEALLTLKRRAF
eukprot:44585-Eustigmatos_ZCMA.PRE.1